MFTPQQVQEKCFSKAFMGGYDMGEVDDFLDPLTEDYATLYKENALLKSKMKVLVEKIEEYRASEESMRQAIQSAKSMANQILEDAKAKSAQMQLGSAAEDEAKLQAVRREIEVEKQRLAQAKQQTAQFVAEMKQVLRAEAQLLENIGSITVNVEEPKRPASAYVPEAKPEPVAAPAPVPVFEPAVPAAVPAPASVPVTAPSAQPAVPAAAYNVDDTVKNIEDSVSKIIEEETEEKSTRDLFEQIQRETAEMFSDERTKPKVKRPFDPELEETRPKFDFTDLRFGKDYEIK